MKQNVIAINELVRKIEVKQKSCQTTFFVGHHDVRTCDVINVWNNVNVVINAST